MSIARDMPGSAADYFGSMVESYDSLIERCVPRYHEMITRLLEYLPHTPGPVRMLELGCGTGNLSRRLAAAHPQAQITFVDASPEMIDITRRRLFEQVPDANARFTFIATRFEELELPAADFEVITSCISLHHVRDKAALYRALFAATSPGGALVFADQLRGSTEAIHELNWKLWLDFCRQPGHCSEEEVQSLLDHAAAHDHYTPLREHIEMLEASGFTNCDCVWRNLIWGIVAAEKRG